MIERLLEQARRRGAGTADALWRRSERTSVAFEFGRLKAAGVTEEAGVNLRVVSGGRVGVAGSTAVAAAPDELVSRALASAELGAELTLAFPSRTPLPHVPTFFAAAAGASLDALIELGAGLVAQLARDGCQVNVSVERELAETRVANSAGADSSYQSTGVVVSADLWRVAGDDVLVLGDAFEGADLPSAADVARIAQSVNTRLDLALKVTDPPEGALPVIFTPAGLTAVLLPLTQALSGKAVLQGISPLAAKVGEQMFDPAFSLTDDALAPGRASSRPVDDECVPSRATCLVQRGVVQGFIYDLETAARAGTMSTGHGQRAIFSKPVVGYTNLIIGDEGRGKGDGYSVGAWHAVPLQLGGGLLGDIADGLLVDDLIGVGQGNVSGGAFSHPVALAYRIRRGEIVGRVKDAAVAGNSYDLLQRIAGFGSDRRWYGARNTPSVLLEGVSVTRRAAP